MATSKSGAPMAAMEYLELIRSSMRYTQPHLLTVLSETDLNRKEGGTRDMIARWPFPERHLNINPDNFLSGTEYSASTVIKHHAFENSNDRPVQFVVCADFPTVDSASVSEIWKTVLENQLEMAIQPVTLTIADGLMVSYDSISGAMELAKHIQDTAKQAGQL